MAPTKERLEHEPAAAQGRVVVLAIAVRVDEREGRKQFRRHGRHLHRYHPCVHKPGRHRASHTISRIEHGNEKRTRSPPMLTPTKWTWFHPRWWIRWMQSSAIVATELSILGAELRP